MGSKIIALYTVEHFILNTITLESESEIFLFDHNTCTVYYESYSFIKYKGQWWLLLRSVKVKAAITRATFIFISE